MQQIHRIVDAEWDKHGGIRKFNAWMQAHPKFKVACMNTVPRTEYSVVYVVVEIPDEEDETNE